ncbi:hypothetical protein ACWD26_39990 [Streptomyces sp. NPDC002787]
MLESYGVNCVPGWGRLRWATRRMAGIRRRTTASSGLAVAPIIAVRTVGTRHARYAPWTRYPHEEKP